MDIQEMAAKIYSAVYGDIDSKSHRSDKQGEIENWLTDDDLDGGETAAELIEDWRASETGVHQKAHWC